MMHRTFQAVRKLRVFVLVSGLCLMISCTEQPPLKIGFVGGLTGRVADLGVAGRDAVILAVEELNQAGGIAGRTVELVIRDDRQDDESARQAIRELNDEQVVAIVGPMTSSVAMVIKPLIDAAGVVTISPTVTSDRLSGLDDYFLRVTAPLSSNAWLTAAYAAQDLQLRNFAVIYDLSNRAFTETWLDHFREALEKYGGRLVVTEAFTSQPDVHFLPIAERVLKEKPDGVLLLSNAIDTALLAQQIRKLESPVALFSSEWAFTTDLISFGGRAVNGMTSFHSSNIESQEVRYLAFKERFNRRFGYTPSFATVLAYDAMSLLIAGLEKNPGRDGLKQTLLTLGPFSGLQSAIKLDENGDIERNLYRTEIADGQFRVIE